MKRETRKKEKENEEKEEKGMGSTHNTKLQIVSSVLNLLGPRFFLLSNKLLVAHLFFFCVRLNLLQPLSQSHHFFGQHRFVFLSSKKIK